MKRTVALPLVAFVALCVQGILFAGPASAHYLTVTASASCVNGAAVISYTATSWQIGTAAGSTPEVDILFNGVVVDAEPFAIPTDAFSGQAPAPLATTLVTVEGVVIHSWGDGQPGGQTDSVDVTIPTDCNSGTGRFTGGGKQVIVDGVTLTKGFEVDCDLRQPSNNLEINWKDQFNGSHRFHMESFDSALCTLIGEPKPPKAPVNKIVASGTGRYDGMEGYTVQFTLIDNGEPGKYDQAGFMVFETADPGNVVLAFPLMTITTGNIQAHVDQR